MEIALLILLSIGGFLYLRKFFAVLPPQTVPEKGGGFGWVDATLASLLLLFLLVNATENFGRTIILDTGLLVASCILYALLMVFIAGILIGRRRNPIRLFGLRWSGWKRSLPLCLLALVAAYPIICLVQVVVQKMMGPKALPQDILHFLANATEWSDRSVVFATAVIFAPIAEEVIFRGYIYGVLRQYAGRWPALFVSALVFSVIHMHLPAIAGLFLFAILLTLIYEKTGSLWAPIAVHAVFNAITVVSTLIFGPTIG